MSNKKFTQSHEVFRELLRELRISKDLTQTELAGRLSLRQSYVSKYETGERRLDFVETFMVCEAMGVGLDEFLKAFSARLAKAHSQKRR